MSNVKTTPETPTPAARAPFAGEVDRMLGHFLKRTWMPREAFMPSVDVVNCDDEVVVRADVPGYAKEDLEISVSEGTLTLKGTTASEKKQEKGEYYFSEIVRGSFLRTLPLPAAVDEKRAVATVKDGVLELKLPKVESATRHTIAIS